MKVVFLAALGLVATLAAEEKLDREAIVRRHCPVLEKADKLTPFGIGLPGQDFVFTADVTGLQTLVDFHRSGQDLNTMAGWAWHEFPNPKNFTLADCTAPHPHVDGTRPYSPMNPPAELSEEKKTRWKEASAWLRSNPHRISLGLLRDSPRNGYLPNGHNYLDSRLPLYLPGNGGLLHAVAMMARGWDGAPQQACPGFPADGSWKVRAEGLLAAP